MKNFTKKLLLVACLLLTIGWTNAQTTILETGIEDWGNLWPNGKWSNTGWSQTSPHLLAVIDSKNAYQGDKVLAFPCKEDGVILSFPQIRYQNAMGDISVSFYCRHENSAADKNDIIQVTYSINGGRDRTSVGDPIKRYKNVFDPIWEEHYVTISKEDLVNIHNLDIGLVFLPGQGSPSGQDSIYIDYIKIISKSDNIDVRGNLAYYGQTDVELTASRGESGSYKWMNNSGTQLATGNTYTISGNNLEEKTYKLKGKCVSNYNNAKKSDYAVGDIITADGFLVKTAHWTDAKDAGKEAVGVVYNIAPNSKNIRMAYIKDLKNDGSHPTGGIDRMRLGPDGLLPLPPPINDLNDGKANMNKLHSYTSTPIFGFIIFNEFTAFKLCYELSHGYDDWYIPAINELKWLLNVRSTVNSTLNLNNLTNNSNEKETIYDDWYWSSTDGPSHAGLAKHAYIRKINSDNYQHWKRGTWSNNTPDGCRVRPIRRFNYNQMKLYTPSVEKEVSFNVTTRYPYKIKNLGFSQLLEEEGKIILDWETKNYLKSPLTYSVEHTKFKVQVFDGASEVYSTNVDWSPSTTSYSKEILITDIPNRNSGTDLTKDYTYRISQNTRPGNFYEATNQTTIKPKKIVSHNISTDPNSDNFKIRVSWEMSSDGYTSIDDKIVKLIANSIEIGEIEYPNDNYISVTPYSDFSPCNVYDLKLDLTYSDFQTPRYQIYSVEEEYLVPQIGAYYINNLNCSKGYYPDKVNLSWQKDGGFTSFIIERNELGDTTKVVIAEIPTTTATNYSYTDNDVQLGLYYNYTIKGMVECGDTVGVATTESQLGFSRSYAVVSGRVTYGSSQAVEGVSISALTDNPDMLKNMALSNPPNFEVPTSAICNDLNNFSFQAHIKPTHGERNNGILNYTSYNNEESWLIEISLDSIGYMCFLVKDRLLVSKTPIPDSAYTAIAATAKVENESLTLSIYKNDLLDTTATFRNFGPMTPNANDRLCIGGIETGFSGYIDEIRIWGKALAKEEVNHNYDVYLNGNETDLNAYYRCDEPANMGINQLFDISSIGTSFNKRDANKPEYSFEVSRIEDNVPPLHLLSHKTYTDQNGNYLLKTMPYTTSGVSYNMVPTLGVHWFNPAQRPLYVNPQTNTFNNIDFIDESSFEMSGTIYYSNTDYPVEGCSFYIDGQLVSVDGEVVKSDAQGKYTISVPIGEHAIQVKKDGHTFESDGRYPKDIDPTIAVTKHNFQEALRGANFYDNTTVPMIGRVAGGAIQDAYTVGFGKSKANIGRATIKLGLQTDIPYNLNNSNSTLYYEAIYGKEVNTYFDIHDTIWASDGSNNFIVIDTSYWAIVKDTMIYSQARILSGVPNDGNYITIQTDSLTGEFYAKLPPIPFKVNEITTSDNNIDIDTEIILPFTLDPLAIQYNTDSLPNGTIDSVGYAKEMKIIYYNPQPSFLVRQLNSIHPDFFGDTTYIYSDETIDKLSIPLYAIYENVCGYRFGNPIFTQQEEYSFEFQGYEAYYNRDYGETLVDTVPLQDLTVSVANEIGRLTVPIDTLQSLPLEENQVTLDSAGKAIYTFIAGLPNVAGDHTLNMNISYTKNGANYDWERNGIFKAYVLGDMPKGNNFVTSGPDLVHTIIRDPSGSGSSAYMAANSTVSTSKSFADTYDNVSNTSITMHLGVKTKIATGLGVAFISDVSAIDDLTAGLSFEYSYKDNTINTNLITTNHRISTSNSPEYVGSMGDVFVGTATNTIIGGVTNINLQKKEGEIITNNLPIDSIVSRLKIGTKELLKADMEFETNFNYTQYHIINTLIPEYKSIRESNLITIPQDFYNAILNGDSTYPVITENPVYITALSPGDHGYGSSNNDIDIWGLGSALHSYLNYGSTRGQSYIMVADITKSYTDTIQYLNSQIKGWEYELEKNEEAKIKTFAKRDSLLINNYSLDAGAIIDHATSSCSGRSDIKTKQFSGGVVLSNELGFSINGLGMHWNILEENMGGYISEDETSTENCTEYGFTLADSDNGNYISVDAINAIDNFGPIFHTRGGATSCPYETGDSTLYYNPGTELNSSTLQVDKPQIRVNQPFVSGIPNGSGAIYNIILDNISEANSDGSWFTLRVVDETNPDGAIISMDGTPLTGSSLGREVYIIKGTTLNKTLVLRQSNLGITDYNDIKIALLSSCQNDLSSNNPVIGDTISISAQFVPTCSNVNLDIPNRIVNSLTGDTLEIIIEGYDKNHQNFEYINLQYKGVNENGWTLVQRFDELDTITGNSITYNFDMSNLTDKQFQFRAVTYCSFGSGIFNESEIIEVTKDTKHPQVFGYPQPADGILSSGDEVSITFNENINANILFESNFSVKGVLNGAEAANYVGLSFNGSGNAYTELPVHLENTSFTIEGWVKRTPGTAGTLFAVGAGDKILSFGFNADNTVFAAYDTFIVNSTEVANYDEWQYIVFGLNRLDSLCQISASTRFETSEVYLFSGRDFAEVVENNGNFYIGSLHDGSNGFTGLVRDVQIWDHVRSTPEVTLTMNINKSGNEAGLLGYWPLDEVIGNTATDKARSRHLTVNTDWYYPNGKSLSLNGTPVYFDASQMPINSTEDYSIEFWFRGTAQNATLFSCGNGAGDLSGTEVSNKLSVAMTDQGALILRTNGNTYTVTNNIGDNQWHHFAMTMKRNSQTLVYVDGSQKINTASGNVGSLAANYIYFGACYYVPDKLQPNNFVTTEPFTGLLDEVRIWRNFLPFDVVKQNMNTRLNGTETGLLLYYPFESYDYDQTPVAVTGTNYSADTCGKVLVGPVAYSDDIPPMKMARYEENVFFEWTASDNKIIFTITEPVNNIEKCFLNFTAQNVRDINGNPMASPATWTAYVNLNTLKWTEGSIEIEKDVEESYTFTTTISNTGSMVEYYNLSQLPEWLSASSYQGTINPLSTQEITFIINDAIAIGKYEAGIALSGNNNYNEILNLSLNVTGNRPIWEVDPAAFTSSMNVIGQIKIQDELQRDPEDMVAAFYGQLCLGVAQPQYIMGSYYVFMDVYGDNTLNAKRLTFKYWDASTGTIYARINVTPSIYYQADAVYGTVAEPVIFRVTDDVTQTYALNNGWNWISTFIESTPNSLSDLEDGLGTYGVMIKSQNEFLQPIYDSTGSYVWLGSENFTNINNTTMYMIQTNQSCNLELSGSLALPADHDITLYRGWTWIGYVPNFTMSINDALAGINPQVNDILKTQQGFSTYLGAANGWVGSLTTLRPGMGYMYKSLNTENITFNYPSSIVGRGGNEWIDLLAIDEIETYWQPNPYQYSGNMTMTAVVEIDSIEQFNGNLELGAFVGDECRGAIELTYVESLQRFIGFLTVYGDMPENVELRLYDHAVGTPINCAVSPIVLFEQNAVYGNPIEPYVASFISDFHTFINASICEGEAYTANGFNVSTAGIHTLNMIAQNGADSIVSLTLTVNPTYETAFEATICADESYTENGFELMNMEAGVYTETWTAQTQQGCDSTLIVTLTVLPTYETLHEATVCEGESYTENGFEIILPEAGTFTETRNETAVNGCDSTIALLLTVIELPNVSIEGKTVIQAGESVTLTATGADTYLWSTGETTAQIIVSPVEETTYSVIGTDENGCVSEEATLTVTIVLSVSDLDEKMYQIYPNPADAKVIIEGKNIESINVYSVVGQLIETITNIQSLRTEIKTKHLELGLYMFRIATKEGQTITKHVVITH